MCDKKFSSICVVQVITTVNLQNIFSCIILFIFFLNYTLINIKTYIAGLVTLDFLKVFAPVFLMPPNPTYMELL